MKKGIVLIIIPLFLVIFVKTTIACPWGMMGSSTQAPKGQNMGMPMDMCSPMMGSMTAMENKTSQGEEKSHKSDQEKETPGDSMEKGSQLP